MRLILLSVLLAGAVAVGPVLGIGPDQGVGQRFEVRPGDLPPPGGNPSASNSSRTVDRPEGAMPSVPPGFRVNIFADGLRHARRLVTAPNGDVFLAEGRAGRVTLLRDRDGDGVADFRSTYVDGFDTPYGMAIVGDALYVADLEHVWRMAYAPDADATAAAPEPVTADGALGSSGGHWTRNLAVAPDGASIFVAIGSRGNIAEEPEPRATVQRFDIEGGGQETFAAGLRNPVGMAFYPGTEDLYVVVNERDGMGDDLVPDYLTRLEPGGFYGWPYAYIGPNPQPSFAARRPDLVARSIVPDLLFQSHSAPLGLAFYDAEQFPAEFRGDAFIALHGSWNARQPRGYKVVRVPFEDGRPVGYYENFATGFWVDGEGRARVWGRPAGVAVAGDGSLLIADDVGQVIWRISYVGS